MGPGYHRGGTGVRREVRVLHAGVLATRLDSVSFPCWGANGGLAGRGGSVTINPGLPDEHEVAPIGDGFAVNAGDVIRVITPGGGGWGDPFTREIERVRADVMRRFISVDGAREDYGVVLDPETYEVDADATAPAALGAAPDPDRCSIAVSRRTGCASAASHSTWVASRARRACRERG